MVGASFSGHKQAAGAVSVAASRGALALLHPSAAGSTSLLWGPGMAVGKPGHGHCVCSALLMLSANLAQSGMGFASVDAKIKALGDVGRALLVLVKTMAAFRSREVQLLEGVL